MTGDRSVRVIVRVRFLNSEYNYLFVLRVGNNDIGVVASQRTL